MKPNTFYLHFKVHIWYGFVIYIEKLNWIHFSRWLLSVLLTVTIFFEKRLGPGF